MGLRGRCFVLKTNHCPLIDFLLIFGPKRKKNGRTTSPLRGSWEFVAPLRLKPTKGQRRVFENESRGPERTGGGFCGFEMGCLSEEKWKYSSCLDGRMYDNDKLTIWLLTDTCVCKSKEFKWKKQDLDPLPPAAIPLIERRKWISQGKPFHNS